MILPDIYEPMKMAWPKPECKRQRSYLLQINSQG